MIRSTTARPNRSSYPPPAPPPLPMHKEQDDTVLSMPALHHFNHQQSKENKLIQCGACFRSFHTQAQFGQHSRICREGKAVIRHLIKGKGYKYAFLEKQTKQRLEVKSRFVVIADSENWKKISRKTGLYDGGIKKMLHSKDITNVDVAIRQRRASGLIIANFMVRNVSQDAKAIHHAKSSIERAVDCVYDELPNDIEMRLHLCKSDKCQELVIRDTEGYCSRHRAQKYHKKNQKNHKVFKAPKKMKTNDTKQKVRDMKLSKTKNIQPLQPSIKSTAARNTIRATAVRDTNTNKRGAYDKLLNHLKATAPVAPKPITNTTAAALEQSDNVNNITIKDDDDDDDEKDVNHTVKSTEDDFEIVAQILANLRATCTQQMRQRKQQNNAKKRKLNEIEPNQDAPPVKKQKLCTDDNDTKSNDVLTGQNCMEPATFYMVPIAMNPSMLSMYPQLQYMPITAVPMQPIPYALVPIVNHANNNNKNAANIPPLPPITSFCNTVAIADNINDDNQSQSTDHSA